MKKIVLIVLSLTIAMSLMCGVSFAEEQENIQGNYCGETNTPIEMSMSQIETLGSVFSTVAPAKFVAFGCPSWSDDLGTMTITLYKWDKDYATTVGGTPVAGPKDFEDFEDNSLNGFEFTDAPLEKGVYYMEISNVFDDGGSGCGVWSANAKYPGQLVIRDGEYVEKLQLRMTVDYVDAVEGNPYGEMPTLEKVDNGMGGTSMEPCPYYFNMPEQDLEETDYQGVYLTPNEDGTLHVFVESGTLDSQYGINFAQFFYFEDTIICKDYPYMAIRLKINTLDKAFGNGECFMYTSTTPGATGGYSTDITYDYTVSDWQTVVIDPTSNATFARNAVENDDEWLGFRFDVLSGTPAGDFEMDIQWIAFFQSEEAAKAFDGKFPEAPTAAPTEVPTDTPAPTEVPTDAPTDVPADPTDAPADSTDAPADPTDAPEDKPEEKKGCGNVIGSAFAVITVLAAAAFITGKKH